VLAHVLATARSFSTSKAAYRGLLILMLVTCWIAGESLGISLDQIGWRWVFLSALLTIPLLAFNAGEYWLIARTNRLDLSFRHCFRVTLAGSVANLLPIPGQSAVRITDLGSRDISISRAANTTLAAGALWSGWIFIFAGAALVDSVSAFYPVTFLILGVIGCALSILWVRDKKAWRTWFMFGSGFEVMAIGVAWWRLSLSFEALGIDYVASGPLVLLCSNVVAAIVGLAPAGLGIREAAAAAISPLINIDPLTAALSVAVTRFIGMTMSSALALLVYRPR